MLSQFEQFGAPDTLVPVRLDDFESVKKKILWLRDKFGFKRFCLSGLTKGHRSIGYPKREDYYENAKKFAQAREWIKSEGLSVGWYCCLTVKSGYAGYTPIICADGSSHRFANCPKDESFADKLSSDIAYYASVAKPDFIFLEDDFSISAAQGCFCEKHLSALAEKCGVRYGREELVEILEKDDPASLCIRKAWADVKLETLVSLAENIRCAVDKLCPEIPIGVMQSGAAYQDGNSSECIARALAGKEHTPFVRFYGTYYGGFNAKSVPVVLFNSLYQTEHVAKDVLCYHESDSYPHMSYYTSGSELTALMAAAYSYGMVGSIFFAQQFLDEPYEEDAYGKYFDRERARHGTLCALSANREALGVELTFNPFYNSLDNSCCVPHFTECVGRFGIPFTTKKASVAFWDEITARYSDGETILNYLSQGLILDGDAARVLTERGYGKYLGVEVGEPLVKTNPTLAIDIGSKEEIKDEFVIEGFGRRMPSAHAYCPAKGREWLRVSVIDERVQIISEAKDFKGTVLSAAMTYFENELGGKICVISQGLRSNHSQSIYNYRRRALLQSIIQKMSDEYPFVKGAPDVYLIASRCAEDTLLTLINLCADEVENLNIYLPPDIRCAEELLTINKDGELVPLKTEKTSDGIRLFEPLRRCEPCYVLIKK